MKSKRKALLLPLCAVLLVVVSVLGTLSYLRDQEFATNTFTVGYVGLGLDETKVNADGTPVTGANRVKENSYCLLPGQTYIKDPTVTVDAGSEDAYVRMIVKVENIDQLNSALPGEEYHANGVFLLQMLCVDENGDCTWDTNWKMYKYTQAGTTGYYEFRYYKVVDGSKNVTILEPLFTKITVPGEIDNKHLSCLDEVGIVVEAHAIQADGFNNADEAWEAFGSYIPSNDIVETE